VRCPDEVVPKRLLPERVAGDEDVNLMGVGLSRKRQAHLAVL
jgi:hypothetical protein